MTLQHTSTNKLVINHSAPPDAINLAYIKTSPMTPEQNITVVDYISEVPENITEKTSLSNSKIMYPDETYKLSDINGNSALPKNDILITDEFCSDSTSNLSNIPLYYCATLSNYIKKMIGSIGVREVYTGNEITVYNASTGSLTQGEYYKIVLEQTLGDACTVYVYANFMSDTRATYFIEYPAYNGRYITANFKEIYNGNKFFEEVNRTDLQNNVYSRTDDKVYAVENGIAYAPSYIYTPASSKRTPNPFRYQVEANLNLNYSQDNPKTLNIGIYYNGDIVEQRASYIDVLASLTGTEKNSSYKPSYLNLSNPHPKYYGTLLPNDRLYWIVDLKMPMDYYRDFDVIIITGYGLAGLSEFDDKLKEFMYLGGKIWIDNPGMSGEVLTLNSFPSTVNTGCYINTTETVSYDIDTKTVNSALTDYNLKFTNRFYELASSVDIGYISGTTQSRFNIDKLPIGDIPNFITLYKHTDETPAVIVKRVDQRGQLLISDCGLLRAASDTAQSRTNVQLVVNILLTFAEDVWYRTQWLGDSVFNRESLTPQEYDMPNINQRYIDTYVYIGDTNVPTAKKVLYNSPREALMEYIPKVWQDAAGLFYVNKEEPNGGSEVLISTVSSGYEPIYAWTQSETGKIETILNNAEAEQGVTYTSDDIIINAVDTPYSFTISAHTYMWNNNDGGFIELMNPTYTSYEGTVNINEGIKPVGIFSALKPAINAQYTVEGVEQDYGEFWANNDIAFYKIRLGKYAVDGSFVTGNWDVSLIIRNELTGEVMPVYSMRDGSSCEWYFYISKADADNPHIAIYVKSSSYNVYGIKRHYAVCPEGRSKIYISTPSVKSTKEPWYIKIHNGSFTRHIDNKVYTYKLSEYDKQAFYPAYPHMRVFEEQAQYVNRHTMRVANTPIFTDQDQPLQVIRRKGDVATSYLETLSTEDNFVFSAKHNNWVYNPYPSIFKITSTYPSVVMEPVALSDITINYEDGTVTFKNYTNALIQATYTYSEFDILDVTSYNAQSGLIQLAEEVDYTDNILATYYYVEENLYYKGFVQNGQYWYLDVNPTIGHKYVQSIYGKASNGIVPKSVGSVDGANLFKQTIYLYLLPYEVRDLEGNLYKSFPSYNVRHAFSKEELDLYLEAIPGCLHIATIMVREIKDQRDNMVCMDTRSVGGGLKKSITRATMQAINRNNGALLPYEQYWDMSNWDTIPYFTNGTLVIKLPKEVRKQFTDQQIEDIVNEYVAFGTLAIIDIDN